MGGLLWDHSLTFAEDLGLEHFETEVTGEDNVKHEIKSLNDWYLYIAKDRYEKAAMNCWIAGAIYVITLIVSVYSVMMNKKHDRF